MSYLNFIPEWVLLAEYKAFEKKPDLCDSHSFK